MGSLARETFLDQPFWFLAMYPVSAVKLYFQTDHDFPQPLYVVVLGILYALALLGLRRLWIERNQLALWTIVAIVAYVTLLTTTAHGSPNTRYLVPVIPLIAVAAAVQLAAMRWLSPSGAMGWLRRQ